MAPLRATLALVALCAFALAPRADEAEDRYRFLAGLVEKGLHELAIEEARGFLEAYPRHPKADLARYRLASALFATGQRAEAEPHYRRLCERDDFEYRAECLFRAGQCAMDAARYQEAREPLRAVLEEEQSYLHPAALYLLGECAQRLGELEEARGRYEQVLGSAPETEHAHAARRALVWVAWQGHDLGRTVTLAEEYLRLHGEDADADEVRVLRGEALFESGEHARALEAYRSVGEESPVADAALRGAGYALAALKQHAGAAELFDRLLERFPRGRFAGEARLQRGVQRLYAGDAAAAAEVLAGADGADPEVLFWLARAQDESGRPEEALETLERAAAASPGAELATRLAVARGALLQKLGRTGDALAAFEGADSEYALAAAAVAGLNEGDLANAERLARRLLERFPESDYGPEARFVLGEASFQREEYGAAREAFAAVAALPQDAEQAVRALARLGWCDYLSGEPAAAARSFERVARQHPEAPEAEEALYMLGRAADEAGDAEAARRARRDYLERYPSGTWSAEVLYALGSLDGEGVELLERLVAEHPESELAPRALFDLAERSAAAGDAERAIETYEALLRQAPRGPLADRARYGLAWLLNERGLAERAVVLLDELEAGEAEPELRLAGLELAIWSHAAAGDPQGSEEAWRSFVALSASDEERHRCARRVAEAWRDAGRPERARAVFEELLRAIDDRVVAVEVLVDGAFAALEEGDVDRAEAQVRVAERQEAPGPRLAEAAFFVGEARYAAEDDERAVALYELAAKAPGAYRDDALYKLGFAHLRRERWEEAARAFAALVETEAESELFGESLFLLGETWYRLGRYQDAYAALARLRREAPRHEVIAKGLFRLGLAAGRLGRWEEAEQALATLAKEHEDFPNLAEAELWRGKALAAQRKDRAARQAFERVVGLDRGALAAEARLGIGELLRAEGRTEEALAEFLKVAVLYQHPEHVPAALVASGECLEALGDEERAAERYREVLADHPESKAAERARSALERLGTR